MRQHTPRQQFKEAQTIAIEQREASLKRDGMFVVDKGDTFLLYRKSPMRPVFLGKRSSAAALRTLVTSCATTK